MNLFGNRSCLVVCTPYFWRSGFPYSPRRKGIIHSFPFIFFFFNWRLQQGDCLTVLNLFSELIIVFHPLYYNYSLLGWGRERQAEFFHMWGAVVLFFTQQTLQPHLHTYECTSFDVAALIRATVPGAMWGHKVPHHQEMLMWSKVLPCCWISSARAQPAGTWSCAAQLIL